MSKSVLRHFLCLFAMLVLCIGNVFSQSVVNFGTDLYSTRYYESMNAANPPAGDWYAVDYDDSNWSEYNNPISFPEFDAFWIRRSFFISDTPADHSFQLEFAHDNEAVIYLNGHVLHDCQGVCGRYNNIDIPNTYFNEGQNVLAAYVLDGGGDQYLECFINVTDGSNIIITDFPKESLLALSNSSLCLYNIQGYSDYTLSAQMITPSGKADSQITWESSNQDVVEVINGQLSAVTAGKAIITASTTYNGKPYSKKCQVEVREIDPTSKVVFVEEPGTLESLLTAEEKDNVDNLTVFGKLDGKDIQVLRYMAGRNEKGNRTPGTLADLDLYNVEFVSGTNGSFKVSNDYTVGIETGKLPNAIFRNCSSLNSIILPNTISRIGGEAFRECTNLELIDIPASISVIEYSAFTGCSNLKSITIPSSVTAIGNEIFSQCAKLEDVVFEENSKLTVIPDWAFGNTNRIKTIQIPSSVTSIGNYAFYDNNNLTEVVFEAGSQLTVIKEQTFYSCDNLQRIIVPVGCLEIGKECFAECYKLSDITIPASVVSIGDAAFRSDYSLINFIIPENSKITSIGANAFGGTGITSLYIPKGLISIDDIFSNNTSLQSLTVHPDNKYYEEIGGIIYSKRNKNAVLVPKSIDGFLSFPDYVTNLPDNLLQGCSRLKGVVLHSGITSLGDNAFEGCAGLQTIMTLSSNPIPVSALSLSGINKSVATLVVPQGSLSAYLAADGWKSFENIVEASNQPTILLSSGNVIVYDVNYESARKSTVLATVITKDGIISVPVSWSTSNAGVATVVDGVIEYAGEGAATITASVTLGDYTATSSCNVTAVGMSSGKMVYVDRAGTLSTLLTDTEKDDLTHLIVMGELNNDDIRVLRYMSGRDEYGNLTVGSLEVLDMGKARIVSGGKDGYYYRDNWWRAVSDNYFSSDIFRECNSLKKVVLPTSLRYLDSYAFSGCQNLEEIVLPDGLIRIDHQAFYNCRKLSKVNIPSSVTELSSWVFAGCVSLKSIDLSTMTGVNSIRDNMFRESGLTSIRIPANITNIENEAFYNTPLKTVEFEAGSRLVTIGDGSFQSTQLQSITIPASVTSINNYAFNDCRSLSVVNYEDNNKLTSLGDNVFNGCPIQTFVIPKRLLSMGHQDFSESLNQIVVEEGNKFFESIDGVLCSKAEGALVFVPKRKKSLYLPEYVTTLKNGVLQYHYDLQMLVLSVNMSDLGDSPFYQCNNLKEIYCLNPVSPTARNLTNDFPQATVYISEGSRNAYLEAGWDDPRITLVEHSFTNSLSLTSSEQIIYNVEGGNHIKLEAKVFSTSGPLPNASIDWISSDPSVVTVDSEGMLSYAGEGTATITASITLDGTVYSDNCLVNTKTIENTENVTFVFVETAGNLHNQISAADKKTITDLVVFGNINGDDIRFIREMAMIPYASWEQTPEGSLEYLDLSGATIVEGGSDYGYAEWVDENGGGHGDWSHTESNVIGKSMFRNSPTLKTIVLPNNVTIIDLYAFRDCPRLENVVLPKSLSFIDYDAFANCPLLSSFVIPETIDSLGMNALRGFDEVYTTSNTPIKLLGAGLISEDALIIVPASALQVYRSADNWKQFAGQIMPDNLNIQSVAILDVIAEDEGSGLLTAAGGDDALAFITDLTLRGTINGRDIAMIRNRMPRLHNLDLSDVIIVANPYEYYTDSHSENNRLGRNAFRELNKLRKVVLPKSIDYVGDCAFYHCENLTSVKMYEGVNTIDNDVFAECRNLVEVDMPEGLLSIGNWAFRDCGKIEEITIPSSVLSMGWGVFQSCYSLKSIILPRNMARIEGESFWYCSNLESVILPSKVNRIENNAFYGCSKLKELRLPPMIESIGDRAFYDCGNIKDVYVYIANSKDIRIDMNTFSCWTSATLHIPNFSYNSYFWDTQWGQFYSKVEFTDTYEEFYTKNTLELNQETGTIQGDPNAVLYEQGGLVVDEIEQVLDAVELKSDGTDGASLIANGNGNIKASKLTINIKVNGYNWHFFCFPFDIPLDSIHYDGEFVWRQYDGKARSRREGGWKDLESGTKKLSKGRGYIFQGTVNGSLSFTIDNPDLSAKDESTTLFTHESDAAQDANWNFVGNPYTSYYNIDETTYSAPITVWTGNGYEAYRPGDDDYRFAPYQAFFVQTPDNAESIGFNADGRESYEEMNSNRAARRAGRRSSINPDRLFVNLEVTAEGEDSYADKTRIVFNNNKSLEYEQSCDAAKFFSESRPIELYSIDYNGAMYSINERPVDDGIVELGITVNVAGTYMIEAARMDTQVFLIDNELKLTHDLSEGGYTFTAGKGNTQRFSLRLGDKTLTNVPETKSSANHNDDSFDLQGRKVNDTGAKGIIIRDGKKVLGDN